MEIMGTGKKQKIKKKLKDNKIVLFILLSLIILSLFVVNVFNYKSSTNTQIETPSTSNTSVSQNQQTPSQPTSSPASMPSNIAPSTNTPSISTPSTNTNTQYKSTLKINSISMQIDINYGASANGNETLAKDKSRLESEISILEGSNLPDSGKQSFAVGHRENNEVAKLVNIKVGDYMEISKEGKVLKYILKETKVVNEYRVDLIQNDKKINEFVLQTCYPIVPNGKKIEERILFYFEME